MSGRQLDKHALRAALRVRHPWLAETDFGPQAVEAGECDRCGHEARMVTTCGPVAWAHLGRACAAEVGRQAWCDGHEAEARRVLTWLAALPAEADDAARLWWVATGEVRLDPALVERASRAALP